jgi:hypothetical protein
MVIMGGGPDTPSRDSSGEKELLLCTLPWPEEDTKKSVDALKAEFKDIEVKYFHTKFENGKAAPIDIPEGMYRD